MTSVHDLHPGYDAIVVGARCAGAATAMLLARGGLSVLAVERGAYASDTLSTHALMRAGVLQLHRWGVLEEVLRAGTPPVRRTSFHYADDAVEIPIKPKDGVDALYAPRRTVLDARLVDAAWSAGATIVHGPRVTTLARDGSGRVTGAVLQDRSGIVREIRASIVVGADGVESTVARQAGARSYRVGTHASAVIYTYWSELPLDGYHWWYRDGVSVGTIPTNDGLTCVFASAATSRFAFEPRRSLESTYGDIIDAVSPSLKESLAGATRVDRWHGFAGRPGFFRQSWGPGWALIGDAGYFKDPITAHGITDALIDAELLANAVIRGKDDALAQYQAERDALAVPLFDVTDEIASYAWQLPRLRDLHHELSREMQREVAHVREWTRLEALA